MSESKKYVVLLPFFPGTYESTLSSEIDRSEEQDAEWYAEREGYKSEPDCYQPEHLRISASEYAELFFKHTDYQATYLQIAKWWVAAFDEWMHEHCDTPKESFTWESMTSPREYNFTTDLVYAYVPSEVIEMLFARSAAEEHKQLAQVIEDSFTSYDGFISFYSNRLEAWLAKPLETWDHNEMGSLLGATVLNSPDWDNRAHFAIQMEELVFGGDDDYRAVDWSKFDEAVIKLRAEKAAAQQEVSK